MNINKLLENGTTMTQPSCKVAYTEDLINCMGGKPDDENARLIFTCAEKFDHPIAVMFVPKDNIILVVCLECEHVVAKFALASKEPIFSFAE